jgi:hypothetical protein
MTPLWQDEEFSIKLLTMTKQTIYIIGSVLAVAVTALIITQRKAGVKFKENTDYIREQHDKLSELMAENARLSNLVAQTTRLMERPSDPAIELLRLRGEVTRLGRNYEDIEKLHNDIQNLRQELRVVRGPTIDDVYAMQGIDTNGFPETGATKEMVLSELQKAGARVLKEDENFIYAEASQVLYSRTNGDPLTITMALWFEDGKLTTRIDKQKWQSASLQQ